MMCGAAMSTNGRMMASSSSSSSSSSRTKIRDPRRAAREQRVVRQTTGGDGVGHHPPRRSDDDDYDGGGNKNNSNSLPVARWPPQSLRHEVGPPSSDGNDNNRDLRPNSALGVLGSYALAGVGVTMGVTLVGALFGAIG